MSICHCCHFAHIATGGIEQVLFNVAGTADEYYLAQIRVQTCNTFTYGATKLQKFVSSQECIHIHRGSHHISVNALLNFKSFFRSLI